MAAFIQKKETYTKLMATPTATDTAQSVAWSATASSNYNYQSWAITGTAYIELKVPASVTALTRVMSLIRSTRRVEGREE